MDLLDDDPPQHQQQQEDHQQQQQQQPTKKMRPDVQDEEPDFSFDFSGQFDNDDDYLSYSTKATSTSTTSTSTTSTSMTSTNTSNPLSLTKPQSQVQGQTQRKQPMVSALMPSKIGLNNTGFVNTLSIYKSNPSLSLNSSLSPTTSTTSTINNYSSESLLSHRSSGTGSNNTFNVVPPKGGNSKKAPPKYKRSIEDIKISETLSPEQRHVVDLVLGGSSIFFTGSAGTGKTYVLREIIQALRFLHGDCVHVTASTGIAACNVGGTTLHSFAAIGLGDKPAKDYIRSIAGNNKNLLRWRQTKVLVIDEISMISAELLDKLDQIGRALRSSPRPFGGIQLVLVGDFCQLPPVSKQTAASYCFRAVCWEMMIDHSILLTKVYRQKDDKFVKVLNELRFGVISDVGLTTLNQCVSNNLDATDGIIPTVLYPHRAKCDAENERKLQALAGEAMVFEAEDEGPDPYRDMLKNMQAQSTVTLKIGAQVILLKNLDFEEELVNGSRGVVVAWAAEDSMPIVKFSTGTLRKIVKEVWNIEQGNVKVASRTQVPLALAWALSIHKSQGMSIDRLVIDLEGTFEYGQAYVALSRATSLTGLQLKSKLQSNQLKVHPEVVEFYKQMEKL
ncbi:hypothetical protein SAMD00019534_025420 [Acytostelium subglobosum LB1]|uniref:hypothetical protein n=1 Tax=Acytostelium subglobosum LB1 TaxID=1410327 RepID=UPI0006451EB8|nr:hypothetical protein SAMD00019534_025420 [Acytostelium subglobosum LB1]GAM19367.1 hypothetical protein SAMD00019534_025420 [Acytostelium subglobosum LB1]|eukprot:XP_012757294.1 hypothetical protein SAMD00019534_025420 [Acytostelium subglobosum LB1]